MKNLIGLRGALIVAAIVVLLSGLSIYYVMAGGGMPFAEAASTCQRAVAKWERENPDLGSAKPLFRGEPAAIDFKNTSFTHAKEFKKVISDAVVDGPDLAGKYAVAQWGCGTSCQDHAVVNMETGKIVAFGFLSEAGVSMSNEYNVIVTNPALNLPKEEDLGKAKPEALAYLLNIPREYYILQENGATTTLSKICTENPFEGFEI